MSERKVINHYISPDFDPKIMPKVKKSKEPWQCEIRNMIPFSMQCNTCATYMYAGKKFNMKMEQAKEKNYLGIKVYRFYVKCAVCSSMITYCTDPKNTGYELESGASRNYELWKDREQATEEVRKEREEEDKLDAMKALENRTLDNKNEIDILDALDEIKAVNHRHEKMDTNAMLDFIYEKHKKKANNDCTDSGPSSEVLDMENDRLVEEFVSSQSERRARLATTAEINNNSNDYHSNNTSTSVDTSSVLPSSLDGRDKKGMALAKARSLVDTASGLGLGLGLGLDLSASSSNRHKSVSGLSISIGIVANKKRRIEPEATHIEPITKQITSVSGSTMSGGLSSLLGAYSDSD